MGAKENFKKLKNVLYLIILIAELAFCLLLLNFRCILCEKRLVFQQFLDGTYGAFLVIMFVICIGLCLSEEFERQTLMAITYCGAIFHIFSSIILAFGLIEYDIDFRLLFSLVWSVVLSGLYLVEALYLTINKDLGEVS